VGYRIEADGGVISYLSDHEPALCLCNGQWPGREWVSGFDLAAETDLLIHDAQYTDEEYDSHVGWGHSSYRHALEFASYVGARKFIAFHHDPDHDDEMLDRLQENAVRSFGPNFAVSDAREGAVFDIGHGAAR
jgi:phosphoribosyl 1,2-cyclic phosphodiesterase